MPFETTLSDIHSRLQQGRFPNEQAISQGIVLRVLQHLGWNTWDTGVVWPEYQTGEGRVDFALCHPPIKPAVFIEVKQPGKAENAVRQALEYAFHSGVPFVVLTDGKTWSFYLPAEQGSYEDRRIYKLDLFERTPAEAAGILTRYLSHTEVESGGALENARTEYRNRTRKTQARSAIPEAWRELVGKGDEDLVDIVATTVESKCGIRPDDDNVLDYLTKLTAPSPPPSGSSVRSPSSNNPPPPPEVVPARSGALVLQGKTYPYSSAKEAMLLVLRELAKNDPEFLERCSRHPDARGRKRKYIARTEGELYPDRPDLRIHQESLPGGWLVATNLNNGIKQSIINLAADVAGLTLGRDLVIKFQ